MRSQGRREVELRVLKRRAHPKEDERYDVSEIQSGGHTQGAEGI